MFDILLQTCLVRLALVPYVQTYQFEFIRSVLQRENIYSVFRSQFVGVTIARLLQLNVLSGRFTVQPVLLSKFTGEMACT